MPSRKSSRRSRSTRKTARAYANLGALQSQRGNREEAEAALKRAVELAPTNPRPIWSSPVSLWSTESEEGGAGEPAIRKTLDGTTGYNRVMALFLCVWFRIRIFSAAPDPAVGAAAAAACRKPSRITLLVEAEARRGWPS